MKALRNIGISALILASTSAIAGGGDPIIGDLSNDVTSSLHKPEISLGAGSLTFYGDITKAQKTNPLIGRMGYDLRITQPFTPFLSGSFYMLWGKVGANERSFTRNINFESDIKMGGVNVYYNFDHFLSPRRTAEPYFSLGIETFEFLSKTDKFDQYGNEYNYWSDGSIRNIAETAENASEAIKIQRDYVYETDIRVDNQDGFGKYQEMSLAVPVGVGIHMKLNEFSSFRLGTTMHFAFTDMIDGISDNSLGNRVGDAAPDRFLFTHFSIAYDLAPKDGSSLILDDGGDPLLAELNNGDEDGDGVTDFYDECAGTSTDAIVDEKGCPLDEDGDGVPDYRDDEPMTDLAAYPVVDSRGVGIGEDYVGPSSQEAKASDHYVYKEKKIDDGSVKSGGVGGGRVYSIAVAATDQGLSPELMNVLLNIPDVELVEQDGQTIVTIGKYNNTVEAIDRREDIEKTIPGAYLVTRGPDGKLVSVSKLVSSGQGRSGEKRVAPRLHEASDLSETKPDEIKRIAPDEATKVFRVQVGAFTQEVKESQFRNLPDMVKVRGEDGFTRYYTGAFTDYQAAARHKVKMVAEGFSGAFVVSVAGGKRLKLSQAGATAPKPEDEPTYTPPTQEGTEFDDEPVNDVPPNDGTSPGGSSNSSNSGTASTGSGSSSASNTSSGVSSSGYNKKYIRFKVQVAAYKNEVPLEVHEQLMKLGNVTQVRTDDGVIKFLTGNFSTYEEAKQQQSALSSAGFADGFVVGEYQGTVMTADQAKKILAE